MTDRSPLIRRVRYLCVVLLWWTFGAQAQTQNQPAPVIDLPDLPAIEMPADKTTIAPDEPPLRDLLAAAHCGQRTVTVAAPPEFHLGATKVTWTAWDGAAGTSKVVATRTATLFVLPNGFAPAGVSGDENATAGNNASRIVRDARGYVHMVWVDSGRPGGRTGPVYRRASTAVDGGIRFDTGPTYLAGDSPAGWNAYPSLAAAGDDIYVAWQGGGVALVRRLASGPAGFAWGPVRDTGAKSAGRDVGPAVMADAAGVHIVTPSGFYAASSDRGQTWKSEPVPLPPGQHMKTASLAIDPAGGVIVAFSSVVRDRTASGKSAGSGGYWQLRTIHHTPGGEWIDARDVLAGFPAWTEPSATEDVLADWVRIAADATGGMHLVWHGTGASRIYANDQAYYAWRPSGGAWQTPVTLVPRDPAHGIGFSFAPSLALAGDRALAGVFYDVMDGAHWAGFDSVLVPLRQGLIQTPRVPMSQFVRASIDKGMPADALSARFPSIAPGVAHTPDGRAWLDVLQTLVPRNVPDAPKLIVYQRLELTATMK